MNQFKIATSIWLEFERIQWLTYSHSFVSKNKNKNKLIRARILSSYQVIKARKVKTFFVHKLHNFLTTCYHSLVYKESTMSFHFFRTTFKITFPHSTKYHCFCESDIENCFIVCPFENKLLSGSSFTKEQAIKYIKFKIIIK